MAVVQDSAATAARAGKRLCAAAVSVSAVCTDLRWLNCAVVQAVGESPVRRTSYGTLGSATEMPETPCRAGHPKSHKTRPQ